MTGTYGERWMTVRGWMARELKRLERRSREATVEFGAISPRESEEMQIEALKEAQRTKTKLRLVVPSCHVCMIC